jgi:radical SAM protein with 4Fe4S-binding SPASM domain
MNRVVWDPNKERTYLYGAGQSVKSLSGTLGMALAADARPDVRRNYPRSHERLAQLGLLDPSEAAIRVVPGTPHLKRLQIEVSLRCNLRCSYCYSTSGPSRTDRLLSRQVLKLVAEADQLGVLSLDFTGGEFLLDPDWRSYVEAARAAGMLVTVHSNGTLIKDETARVLTELGVASVQVSLDSHRPEIHDRSRGHRGALARTLAGIEHLQRHGLTTRISVMAHKDNVDHLGDSITELSRRFPRARINVDRVVRTGGAVDADNGLTAREFWSFLKPYINVNVQAGRICDSYGIDAYEPACGVAYSYVYVTADGEYAVCPTMTSRESDAFRGPRVDDVDLSTAWYDSELFNSFRHTNCENVTRCPAGRSCGGGCRSNAYVEEGYVTAPDVVSCNLLKNRTGVFLDFPKRYSQGEFGIANDVA